ncbi:MAG: DNA cytosine methyltransferase [Candidatus Paceibacterota bacterium]
MKIVSLFSGVGGMDLGFKLAGHEIIWANDNWTDAVNTYKLNIGDPIIEGDIQEVKNTIPNCDIVIGGFPCQGFSVANRNRHKEDIRNQLYLEFVSILEKTKPPFFLAENVKGILSLDDGIAFEKIVEEFSKIGYNVNHMLLNAADYGVPQKRERVFIYGVRKDYNYDLKMPPAKTHSCNLDEGLNSWVTVGDVLKNVPDPDKKHALKNHVYSKFKIKWNGYLGHRPVSPNEPSPTITARGDKKGGVVIHPHPNRKRRMSVREAAIIQSFPLDFEFFGSKTSAYRQIANAVPPKLSFQIAKQFPDKA